MAASRVRGVAGRRKGARREMESGPAIFVGVVFALFGGGLLVWTAARVRHGAPVAHGVNPVASAVLASVAALVALEVGAWCLTLVRGAREAPGRGARLGRAGNR